MLISPVIVDYGMGNLGSVSNAFARLGVAAVISSDPNIVCAAPAIVLPGVGAFGEAMRRLRAGGLADALNTAVCKRGIPFLGICLGMHLVAERSEEGGDEPGLGWIAGRVVRITEAPGRFVPHVGWNDVHASEGEALFRNIVPGAHYYFDHSYDMDCSPDLVIARVEYAGRSVVAAIRHGNILAAQFHPEKSQNNGLRLFRNFLVISGETQPERVAC
ncbi:MAG: imidazole glycerol phosphate synthase subunit HisH [Hyphomicrobiales bacterium]